MADGLFGEVSQVTTRLVHQCPAGFVTGVGGFHHQPGLLCPIAAARIRGVEQCDQLAGFVHTDGVQQCPAEPIRLLALVHPAQAVPDSLAPQPVTATLIPQEVAPATGPGFLAGVVLAPRG
ncbi:hypothetical protein D3C73_1228450 [compost metagenome]